MTIVPMRGILAALAAAALSAPAAMAQGDNAAASKPTPAAAKPGPHLIKLVNGAKGAINAIYFAQPHSLDWSDDLLGAQVAGPGKTVTLKIVNPAGGCVVDLQFLMGDGSTVERPGVNVCDQPSYAFAP